MTLGSAASSRVFSLFILSWFIAWSFCVDPCAIAASEPRATPLLVEPRDRVLFVGDEVTQQMMYTRATATALLQLQPGSEMRFFAGGREGATVASVTKEIDELLTLTQPTVVTVLLGMHERDAADYATALKALTTKIRSFPGVRVTVLLSPLPIQTSIAAGGELQGQNVHLREIARATQAVAQEQKVVFVDLFDHMVKVYDASNQTPGAPLTHEGRLPTEAGQVVIASMVLWGLGLEESDMAKAEWSPIKPIDMRRIRQVLAFRVDPPSLERAQQSRDLYESMRRHDELFFRAWRIAGRKPSGPSRQDLMKQADEAWLDVLVRAQEGSAK